MNRIAHWLASASLLCLYPASSSGQVPFDEVFEWVGSLILEDRDEALNASPSLRSDPAGGWIVSDRMENQIRVYNKAGALLRFFGRAGGGPGEFTRLVGAVRAADQSIVAVDSNGRIAVWDSAGVLTREFTVPARFVLAAGFVPPRSLVLTSAPQITGFANRAANVREFAGPAVHLVDLDAGQIAKHILTPLIDVSAVGAWSSIFAGGLEIYGERYLVTLPLADTIWEFSAITHEPVSRTVVRHPLLEELARIPDGHADRAAFSAWARRAHFMSYAAPARDGAFFLNLVGVQKESRVLSVSPRSHGAVEVTDSPALVAYDPTTSIYVFDDPDSLEPNRFRLARLKANR